MKYIILLILIFSALSFSGGTANILKTSVETVTIDKELEFCRSRALHDNTNLQRKLNELVNNLE